jgi:hypothetical protein
MCARCIARDKFCHALVAFEKTLNEVCEVAHRMDGIAIPAQLRPLVHDLAGFFAELDQGPKGKDFELYARPREGMLQ